MGPKANESVPIRDTGGENRKKMQYKGGGKQLGSWGKEAVNAWCHQDLEGAQNPPFVLPEQVWPSEF